MYNNKDRIVTQFFFKLFYFRLLCCDEPEESCPAMSSDDIDLETRQVYFIQTEGPDGLQSTEVCSLVNENRSFHWFIRIGVFIGSLG